MQSYRIYIAAPQQASDIHHLTINGIQSWGSDVLSNLKPWINNDCSEDNILHNLQSAEYIYLIAENNEGQIIGTINLNIATQYMGGLYCSIKRKGLGTALLKELIELAHLHQLPHFSCEIRDQNKASIALMLKHGATKHSTYEKNEVIWETYTFNLN